MVEKQTNCTFHIKKEDKDALIAEIEKFAVGNPYILHQKDGENGELVVTLVASSFTASQAQGLKKMEGFVNVHGVAGLKGSATASMSLLDDDDE